MAPKSFSTSLIEDEQLFLKSRSLKAQSSPNIQWELRYLLWEVGTTGISFYMPSGFLYWPLSGRWLHQKITGLHVLRLWTRERLELHLGTGLISCSVEVPIQTPQCWHLNQWVDTLGCTCVQSLFQRTFMFSSLLASLILILFKSPLYLWLCPFLPPISFVLPNFFHLWTRLWICQFY